MKCFTLCLLTPAATLLLAPPTTLRAADAPTKKPNIVFIYTDDQPQRALGSVDPYFSTPHMDRLAKESVVFNHSFVTTANLCGQPGQLLHRAAQRAEWHRQFRRASFGSTDEAELRRIVASGRLPHRLPGLHNDPLEEHDLAKEKPHAVTLAKMSARCDDLRKARR